VLEAAVAPNGWRPAALDRSFRAVSAARKHHRKLRQLKIDIRGKRSPAKRFLRKSEIWLRRAVLERLVEASHRTVPDGMRRRVALLRRNLALPRPFKCLQMGRGCEAACVIALQSQPGSIARLRRLIQFERLTHRERAHFEAEMGGA
jgi:hypothetical protein